MRRMAHRPVHVPRRVRDIYLATSLCVAAAAAATAAVGPAGGGIAWAAGDPAQYEEVVRREIAGLDRSIAGIREEIEGLGTGPAGRPEVQERSAAERRGQERFDSAAIGIRSLESEIEEIEGLKADLRSLYLAIALAPGTADSVPSTEGTHFKVIVVPDVVAGFRYRAAGGISIDLVPGEGRQTIHLGIPAGLPHRGGWLDPAQGHLLVPIAPFSAMRDVGYALGECYTFISVTVSSGSTIYYNFRHADGYSSDPPLHEHPGPDTPDPRSELHGKWLDSLRRPAPVPQPPVVSPAVPDGCGGVALEPPFDPPLKQVHRDGILADAVACNSGLVPHVRGEGSLCLRPETLERLVASGVLEPEYEETLELARRLL